MSTKPKIFENALLVSLEVKLFGATKTSSQLTRQLIEQNDIKQGRARASVDIIPKEYERGIRKPVTDARRTIKQYTVPWLDSSTDSNQSKTGRQWYLCMSKHLPLLDTDVTKFRMRWDHQTRSLFSNWSAVLKDASVDLGNAYDPSNYPPLEQLKEAYHWDFQLKGLYEITDSHDARLKASEELIERCVEGARREQSRRIANAIGSMARQVKDFAEDVAGRMDYNPDPKDGRKGNTLPKAPTWKELSRRTDTLEDMNEMFEDDALSDTVTKMRDFEDRVRKIGSANDVRHVLKENQEERENFKESIDEIGKSVLPALNRFDDLMSS